MFDYRYHALSLAAVLLALAVGVVIGVAIGDSNLVSSAKSGIVHDLSAEVGGAQRQAGALRLQLGNEETFANDLYPIAVHGLLNGRNVGLVFLGDASNRIDGLVRSAVTQAGGNLSTVVAVREPLELSTIAHEAVGTRYAALGAEPSSTGGSGSETSEKLLQPLGVIIGKQFVSGGPHVERELISRVRGGLLSAFDGQLGKLEGVVIVRNEPSGMSPQHAAAAGELESGLVNGLAAKRVPAVGVELSSTEPSQVPWYQGKNIASVDDLDATAGQAALIYALTGSRGAYGTKPTADSLLPNVVGGSTQP